MNEILKFGNFNVNKVSIFVVKFALQRSYFHNQMNTNPSKKIFFASAALKND